VKREPRPPIPAEVLKVGQEEAVALSAVAPLVGTTPRTVKRFVNIYRLIKARVPAPYEFGHPRQPGDPLCDHEAVAFLLGVLTGRPAAAAKLLPALINDAPQGSIGDAVKGLTPPPGADPVSEPQRTDVQSQLADVSHWLGEHPDYAQTPASRFTDWSPEVARFSYSEPG